MEEKIEQLSDDTGIDPMDDEEELGEMREVLVSEAKTFKCRAIVGYLTGSPFIDFSKATLQAANPVPVRNEDSKVIGHCSLSVENKKIVGDFFLVYSTPERMDIEMKSAKWYPRIVGKLFLFESSMNPVLDLRGDMKRVKALSIDAIQLLHSAPNTSLEYPLFPLGEQVL